MTESQQDRDIETLARTAWGEARGEGLEGMLAVACCIRNRVKMDLGNDGRPDWWGEGYEGVCRKPWQFSCWNASDPNSAYLRGEKTITGKEIEVARIVAKMVVNDWVLDTTHGATHYYARHIKAPAWTADATLTRTIGAHRFFKDVP